MGALIGERANEKGSGKGDGKNFFARRGSALRLDLTAFAGSLGIDSEQVYGRCLGDNNTAVDIVAVAISDLCVFELDAEFIEGFLEGLWSYASPGEPCGNK